MSASAATRRPDRIILRASRESGKTDLSPNSGGDPSFSARHEGTPPVGRPAATGKQNPGRPVVGGNRRVARRAGAWASIALGVGLLIGATAAPSSAAPSKDGAGKALLQKIVQSRTASRAAAAAALPRDTASKPLTVSPHTGLKNNTAVQVSAPSGTLKANDAPLVAVECNPDPSIPQDGSGCTAAKFLTGASAGNASGGVNTFSFTVKEGKIGSNS